MGDWHGRAGYACGRGRLLSIPCRDSESETMTALKEIGRVGGWRYVVIPSGELFEVWRLDIRAAQAQEFLAEAPTFKSAARKAVRVMVQGIKTRGS